MSQNCPDKAGHFVEHRIQPSVDLPEDHIMTHDQSKPTPTDQVREAARTERHPEVPDHAIDEKNPAVPGGNRPDAAVAEDPAKPGLIDKSKT